MAPEIAHLPVARDERERRGRQGAGKRLRIRMDRGRDRRQRRCPLGEQAPSLIGNGDHRRHISAAQFARDVVGCEEAEPMRERREADRVAPAPEVGVHRGHVIDERGVHVERDDVVAFGDQVLADVVHQHRQPRARARTFDRHRDERVVDAIGRLVIEPGAPRQQWSMIDVAGDPHDPVLVVRQRLQEVALSVDRADARTSSPTSHRSSAPALGRLPRRASPRHWGRPWGSSWRSLLLTVYLFGLCHLGGRWLVSGPPPMPDAGCSEFAVAAAGMLQVPTCRPR